jgi:hypothetical protein
MECHRIATIGRQKAKDRIRGASGRTRVEVIILIVLGMVAIGFLIPLISKEKGLSGGYQKANEINILGAAIDSYYGDFKAYPGPIADADLIDATPLENDKPGGAICTSSQNLVWGLMGGFEPNYDQSANGHFVAANVGRGSMSFSDASAKDSPSVSRSCRYRPYLDTQYLLPHPWDNPYGISFTHAGVLDSAHNQYPPEFVDRFPHKGKPPAPILYLRARVVLPSTASRPAITTSDDGAPAQYDNNQLRAYGKAYPELLGKTPPKNPSTGKPDYASWDAYFEDPATIGPGLTPQARHADSYLLISPGADGVFGTADDISN